ncbi:uncharacterized protein LOC129749459 [Uranotaenia lowii]|uniref:uncharacterized protein LOC129749459 n=1 Tax=Uranotaenia lowii TaxID=190385 RepID=UPI00247A1F80|nr:uncharacterized protein LOC129749459 [Uranotaenia lowii]
MIKTRREKFSMEDVEKDPLALPLPKSACRTQCIVHTCRQRLVEGISLHTFPKKEDKKRYETWLRVLKLSYEPSKSTRVCSNHFSIPNFIPPDVHRTTSRMILRPNAIPDMNLPQAREKPKVTKKPVAKKANTSQKSRKPAKKRS